MTITAGTSNEVAAAFGPSRLRLWALTLVAWTAFIWISRTRNILDDAELVGAARTWRLAVALGFLVLGALAGAEIVRKRRALALWVLATVGPIWWLIRGVQTLLGEWSVGFKVVHTLLAIVVFALSGLVIRALRVGHGPALRSGPLWESQSA